MRTRLLRGIVLLHVGVWTGCAREGSGDTWAHTGTGTRGVAAVQADLTAPRPERFDPVHMGRLYAEYSEYKEIYDWLEWGRQANDAAQRGEALPETPRSTWGTGEITKRLDGLERLARSMGVPPAPNIPPASDLTPSPQLERQVETYIQQQEIYLSNLEERQRTLRQIDGMMSEFRQALSAGAAGFQAAISAGVPDVGGVLQSAWGDLAIVLPGQVKEVTNRVDAQQRAIRTEHSTRRAAYDTWRAAAQAKVQDFNAEQARQAARRNATSGRGDAAGAGRGRRPGGNRRSPNRTPPTHDPPIYAPPPPVDRPRPRPDPGPTVGGTVLGLVTASGTPELPIPVEFWDIPPELWVIPPPEEPGMEVPDGGQVLLVPLFPGDSSSIDIWAEDETGSRQPVQTYAGNCGGAGSTLFWSNDTGQTLTLYAAGYRGFYEGDAAATVTRLPRVARSDQLLARELSVFAWGFRPSPPMPHPTTATMNDAVLLVVRTDDGLAPTAKGETAGRARFEMRGLDGWNFAFVFPNEVTSLNFAGKDARGVSASFLGRHQNGWGGHYTYTFRRGSQSAMSVDLSATAVAGSRALGWREQWLNPFLYVAGAGHATGTYANTDRPYRALMLAVAMDTTDC